ncbi:MAG: ATP-dependent zinc metalloprotease FtsH [Phascolarctobacterium succinatutens]|jgi:cell division protease FtsH|uniref:ATP-dependent zinc metalloprotease FtsH n=2 Tax=Phascolarctobacterium succinatutens TaxID=626940 RepID=E8LCG9_9FIRM|nr:ATP-dependent zinc metalloprotease FtsH [Phascolarctobacterium succinatutens]EFY05404.1 ATP-dependent metallopeptidase HflB [Phascolarctobacterium succinatutens YIT 12067]MCI6543877.1 ATP-dependent zinc metalloprotease FtsH [Phascolarctobacterium succinatutens]MDD7141017.1 ATP-dependent zinc metalloprotease FtsH [Phascolarctobacterium succinatutens]MEE0356599.1 ATP-dependent zinc metalloprotease FtsH [Phascolarctobacterium succinatutens]UQT42226.1 ATP-dependent zinc metalloprotease FtsH [Ph
MMNDNNDKKRPLTYYYMLMLVLILVFNSVIMPMFFNPKMKEVSYNNFLQMVDEGKVSKVEITDKRLAAVDKNNEKEIYVTGRVEDPELANRLMKSKVEFTQVVPKEQSPLVTFFTNWVLPILIFFGLGQLFMYFMGKRMGGNAMSFGKSNAKVYVEAQTGKSFADVAGQDEAKEALMELVDFLHNPGKYKDIGANMPKGALLVGPPGTGKTLLARAVAGEAKVPFFSISGSEFVEMFVGMGAARVRDLFKQAQEKAPCIVFIDEIDAIGKRRDNGQFGGNDEREQTLNQLLSEMDGFDGSKGVVILAATNRPESLDKALLRPGRFDRRIPVELPDLKGREAILKVHARNVRMADNIDYGTLARATAGASGAELANIINEGALRAVKMHRNVVEQEDLEESIETVIAGYQRKGAVISLAEKKVIAYHEIGHALVAAMQKHSAPVHKITIIPRTNGALGYTMQISENDSVLMTKEELFNKIVTMTGGRSAEEVVFGSITSGASNDIEQATKLARSMVTRLGMTEEFDMMATEVVANRYLGGDAALQCSETTAGKIDAKVLALIKEAHAKARTILQDNRNKLDVLAQYLLEKETITGEQFMALLQQEQAKENAEEKTPEE